MKIEECSFDEVRSVWEKLLWPGRQSPIKAHSSLCYLSGHDMAIYNNPVYFFKAIGSEGEVMGVNSCFQTTSGQFRSRGLFVLQDFRGCGVGKLLLEAAKDKARENGALEIWSMPRKGSEQVYNSAGFSMVGDWFDEGVEFGPNIFCIAKL